jgi:HK97 family phage prohead protease
MDEYMFGDGRGAGEGCEVRVSPIEGLETRSGADGRERRVSGYACVFGRLSAPLGNFRERIARGAFAETLRSRPVKAFWNHNKDLVLGSTKNGTLKLAEDEIGLRFELSLPDTGWGRDAYESIRRGDVDGVSFGFHTLRDSWEAGGGQKQLVRTVLSAALAEISPTAIPAYPESSVAARSLQGAYEAFARRAGAAAGGAGWRARERRKLELLEREVCIE